MPGVPLRSPRPLPLAGYGRGVLAPPSTAGRSRSRAIRAIRPASAPPTSSPRPRSVALRSRPLAQRAAWRRDRRLGRLLAGAAARSSRPCGPRRARACACSPGRVTSPTLLRQIDACGSASRAARWHALRAGRRRCMRAPARCWPSAGRSTRCRDLDRAEWCCARRRSARARAATRSATAARLRRAAQARRRRRASAGSMRSEPAMTLTGANADHRLALRAATDSRHSRLRLRRSSAPPLPARRCRTTRRAFAATRSRTTSQAHHGRALVLAGRGPAAGGARAGALDQCAAAAPVDVDRRRSDADAGRAAHRSAELVAAISAPAASRRCSSSAPTRPMTRRPISASPTRCGKVPFSAASRPASRTRRPRAATWHLPALASARELGRPARASTAPRHRPAADPAALRDALRAPAARRAARAARPSPPTTLVRETWRATGRPADFEAWWRQALHDGVIAGQRRAAGHAAARRSLPGRCRGSRPRARH